MWRIPTTVLLGLLALIIGCSGTHTSPSKQPSDATSAAGSSEAKPPKAFDAMPAPGTRATCATTGHVFTVDASTTSSVHEGKTYVFCCPGCKTKFDADPAKALENESSTGDHH